MRQLSGKFYVAFVIFILSICFVSVTFVTLSISTENLSVLGYLVTHARLALLDLFSILGNPILVLLAATLLSMTVLILLTAKFCKGSFTEPGRALYFAAILPPLFWLLGPIILFLAKIKIYWQSPFLKRLHDALVYRIEDWYILPFGLLLLVFMVYVFYGIKGSQAYKDIFKPRKLVWFVFGLGILFVIWFVPNTLLNAKAKFIGTHVDVMFDAGEATKDINIAANHLRDKDLRNGMKAVLSEQTEALEKSLNLLRVSISTDLKLLKLSQAMEKMAAAVAEAAALDISADSIPEIITSKLNDATAAAKEAKDAARRLAFAAATVGVDDVKEKAEALQQQLEIKIIPQFGTARKKVGSIVNAGEDAVENARNDAQKELNVLHEIVGTAAKPAEESVVHRAKILAEMAVTTGLDSGFDMQTRVTIRRAIEHMLELIVDIQTQANKLDFNSRDPDPTELWRINEVQDKAHALELAGEALRLDLGAPMLMVALLFLVFLLMPWLLYISFIVRKREQIINDRLELLRDLDLLKRFRNASKLSRDLTIEGANIARELICSSQAEIDTRFTNLGDRRESLKECSLAFKKFSELRARQLTESEKDEIRHLADTETLNRHTFNSREYLIPLIILSVLSLVGWYYTIFAAGTNGLVRFIEQGGGSTQLTELLSQLTPFTMVFAGAWLFMILLLTYRWVNNDLHPGSYFYVSIRLVYGLLVGMVFLALFKQEVTGLSKVSVFLLAFFVGMAPIAFVNALWGFLKEKISNNSGAAGNIMKYLNQPKWASHQPLTVLEDITLWDDTRFYQEGIQNVHALATVDLVRLAMRMPYDAQTLVDWVDQALLRIHTKVLWHAGMAAIGIRGATDLLDDCGVGEQREWSDEKLTCVVNAFNEVQPSILDIGDPRFVAYNEASILKTECQALSKTGQAAKNASEELEPTQPETLDNIIALRSRVSGLKATAGAAAQARQQAYKVLESLGVKNVAEPWGDGGEVNSQLKALAVGAGSLITKAENAVKDDKLTSKILEDELAKTASLDKPGQAALHGAKAAIKALVDPADKANKAAEKARPQLTEMKVAIHPVKEKVDALHGIIENLVNKVAEVKSKGEGLTQANVGELKLDEVLTSAFAAETGAAELAAAGEQFSILKDKTLALKKTLGAGTNQLQAKIKAAQSEIANAAKNASTIAAAKNAVNKVVAATGTAESINDKTIAGQMKAIAEPFQDVEVRLKKATTTVADLTTAITQANTLAQSIHAGDAGTWDNVKALAGTLHKLETAFQSTEKARCQMSTKLDGLEAQQVVALCEGQKKLKELATDAKSKVQAADNAFSDKAKNVVLSAGSSEVDLKEAIKKVESAVTAVEMLASGADTSADEVMRTALPFRLTKEILQVMLGAMKNDPNIHYIQHFWRKQVNKIKESD